MDRFPSTCLYQGKDTDQAGASRSAVKPKDEWIIVGVSLRIEEDVVEVASGKVEIA
jgi:hypothetical protein